MRERLVTLINTDNRKTEKAETGINTPKVVFEILDFRLFIFSRSRHSTKMRFFNIFSYNESK